MDADREAQVKDIIAAYAQIVRATMHETVPAWQALDLTVDQLKALLVVAHRGALAMGRLASLAALSRAAATKPVDGLVQRGLVTRTEDPLDRRHTIIRLTEHGVTLLDRPSIGDPAQLRARLERLEVAELVALTHGLHALSRALGGGTP